MLTTLTYVLNKKVFIVIPKLKIIKIRKSFYLITIYYNDDRPRRYDAG